MPDGRGAVKIKRAHIKPRDPISSGAWEVEVAVVVDAGTADEALAKVAGALKEEK
jgi:hypothetical protein